MAADEILVSPEDLEGATVVSAPKAKRAPSGGIKLSADDLEGAEVVSAPAPAPVDVRARARAESLRPPGPREVSSEEAGTSAGPISARPIGVAGGHFAAGGYQTEQSPGAAAPPIDDYTRVTERYPGTGSGVLDAFGPAKTIKVTRGNQQEMADPLVQMGTATALGMAAGAVPAELAAGGPVSAVRAVPPPLATGGRAAAIKAAEAIAPSIETGVANKSMGGDFTAGAALGAIPGMLPGAAGGGVETARATSRAMGEGLERRMIKDVTKGKKPSLGASKATTEEVKALAGPDGERLTQTVHELPETRKAIMVTSPTNPGAAAKVITKDIDAATAASDADFAEMQRQHGGVPLQPYVDRLKNLEDLLNLQKRGAEADAIGRVRADILKPKRHGLPGKTLTPEQLAELKISADGIRNMRNDIGGLIDPTRTIEPNTKASAMKRVHDLLNKEIEDVAENTRGVDVEALRKRNRQVSTLIPVRDALLERAEKLADRDIGIGGKLKELPGKAIKSTARRVRHGLSSFPEANPAPASYAGPTPFPDDIPRPTTPVEPPIVYPNDELRRRREIEALGLAAAAGNRR